MQYNLYCNKRLQTSLKRIILINNAPISARALVKKAQEPGIKLQIADFFRNDTWTSPPDECRRVPKNSPCAFFLIQDGRHHVTLFSKKTGVYPNSSFLQLEKNI